MTTLVRPSNPLYCAAMSVVIGLQFLLASPRSFRSSSYQVPFSIGRPTWGWLFLTVGVLVFLTFRTRWASEAYAVMLAVILAWTTCSWISLLNGTSAGVTGPVIWSAIAGMLATSIARFGSGRPRVR